MNVLQLKLKRYFLMQINLLRCLPILFCQPIKWSWPRFKGVHLAITEHSLNTNYAWAQISSIEQEAVWYRPIFPREKVVDICPSRKLVNAARLFKVGRYSHWLLATLICNTHSDRHFVEDTLLIELGLWVYCGLMWAVADWIIEWWAYTCRRVF